MEYQTWQRGDASAEHDGHDYDCYTYWVEAVEEWWREGDRCFKPFNAFPKKERPSDSGVRSSPTWAQRAPLPSLVPTPCRWRTYSKWHRLTVSKINKNFIKVVDPWNDYTTTIQYYQWRYEEIVRCHRLYYSDDSGNRNHVRSWSVYNCPEALIHEVGLFSTPAIGLDRT